MLNNLTAYIAGDADAQDAMLEAAYESGCAIRISRTTAAHAMSYQITKKLGPAHGHACMLTLPHLWAHLQANAGADGLLRSLTQAMGLSRTEDGPLLLKGLLAATGLLPEALTEGELRQIYVQALTPMDEDTREAALSLWRQYDHEAHPGR